MPQPARHCPRLGSVLDTSYVTLTPTWHVKEEARGFYNMYKIGRTTVERASRDILMSDTELNELVTAYPEDEAMIKDIQAERQRTFDHFLALVSEQQRVQ